MFHENNFSFKFCSKKIILLLIVTTFAIASINCAKKKVVDLTRPCSSSNPNGTCDSKSSCLEGVCTNKAKLCSEKNLIGLCANKETCMNGFCLADNTLCGNLNIEGVCEEDKSCVGGLCVKNEELCTKDNDSGVCEPGKICQSGDCISYVGTCSSSDTETCSSDTSCVRGTCIPKTALCNTQNPFGLCEYLHTCIDGSCVSENNICSADNPDGECSKDLNCKNEQCATDKPCSKDALQGYCDTEHRCIDGECKKLEEICSKEKPDGLCKDRNVCIQGQCLSDTLVCSSQNKNGICENESVCVDGNCVAKSDLCSPAHIDGTCPAEKSCFNGSCLNETISCSVSKPDGSCQAAETCAEGSCIKTAELCSAALKTGKCPSSKTCVDGACITNSEICSVSHPQGKCANSLTCHFGECLTSSEICSKDNTIGKCQSGKQCLDGECVAENLLCSVSNTTGWCEQGKICISGVCDVPPGCYLCAVNQTCIDGICRDDSLLCSNTVPTGICQSGYNCLTGQCVDGGYGCSSANPTGVCGFGEICNNGQCQPIDGLALCDDNNDCTDDEFDFVKNRCIYSNKSGSCDDNNSCTNDACSNSICVGTHINGCVEPPTIEHLPTHTKNGQLIITGTKIANSAVWINSQEAIAENTGTTWQVTVNLVPGKNTFLVQGKANGTLSGTNTVTIVYDVDAPLTSVTPDSGVFLNPITITVATNEPATVYYTTNGTEPDEFSESFVSTKQFRIIDASTLKFYAVDLAGNIEETVKTVQYDITSHANGWTKGTDLPEKRIHAASVYLENTGILYLLGGSDGVSSQDTVYSYHFDTKTWETETKMPEASTELSAVATDNKIYVFGGEHQGSPKNTVQIYDTVNKTWSISTVPMPTTRFGHKAILNDFKDKVYVFGGKSNSGVLNNFEIYTIASNQWSNTVAQMPRARYGFGADVWYVQKKIYVFGGQDNSGNPIKEVDIYDIMSNTWSQGADMPHPRSFFAGGKIQNVGNLTGGHEGYLVAGGRELGGLASAIVEEYDYQLDKWFLRTPLDMAVYSGASEVFSVSGFDNKQWSLWIFGGQILSGITKLSQYYQHGLDYLWQLSDLPVGRFMHAAETIHGKMYIFGGRNFTEEKAGWMFDPETEVFESIADLPSFQSGLSSVSHDGLVYAIGGTNNFGVPVATMRSYDPILDTWTELNSMTTARKDAVAVIIDDSIYVIGGYNGAPLTSVEIYHIDSDTWAPGPILPEARTGLQAVVINKIIYIFGGIRSDGSYDDIRYLNTAQINSSWQWMGGYVERAFGKALAINENRVIIIGGRDNSNTLEHEGFFVFDIPSKSKPAITVQHSLVTSLEYSAVTSYMGKMYAFGGHTDKAAFGEVIVQKFHTQCFDGIQNGKETLVDVSETCGTKNLVPHSDGFTTTPYYNTETYSTSSRYGAIQACRHYYESIGYQNPNCTEGCGNCNAINLKGTCVCGYDYNWYYGPSSCWSGVSSQGDVRTQACSGTNYVGQWY